MYGSDASILFVFMYYVILCYITYIIVTYIYTRGGLQRLFIKGGWLIFCCPPHLVCKTFPMLRLKQKCSQKGRGWMFPQRKQNVPPGCAKCSPWWSNRSPWWSSRSLFGQSCSPCALVIKNRSPWRSSNSDCHKPAKTHYEFWRLFAMRRFALTPPRNLARCLGPAAMFGKQHAPPACLP